MNQEATDNLTAMTQERDELQRQLDKIKERRFPILHNRNHFPDAPGFIPWSIIEQHEACAQRNHSQSLNRLAQRGGLDPTEALAVMTNQNVFDLLKQKLPDDEVVAKLKDAIARQSPTQPATGDMVSDELKELRLVAILADEIVNRELQPADGLKQRIRAASMHARNQIGRKRKAGTLNSEGQLKGTSDGECANCGDEPGDDILWFGGETYCCLPCAQQNEAHPAYQEPESDSDWLPIGDVPTETGWWWTPDTEFPNITGGVILRRVRLSNYDQKLWCGDYHVSEMNTRWLKAIVPPLPPRTEPNQ